MITLRGYEILESLYRGKGTSVYRGIRTADRRPVVLKVLNAEYPSPGGIARMRRDFEIRRRLDFDGIVRAHALEPFGNGTVLVLEDFEGVSLKALLAGGKLELRQALRVAVRLADILQEIHDRGVIHKDIKPENILIHPGNESIKITDFGIATLLSREKQQIMNPGMLEGSLHYLSPEQTGRMNRSLDTRADLYSLGATFYAMLSGHPPFESNDPLALLHAHIARKPRPLHADDPDVPEILGDIVGRLLNKDPEDRYRSAAGLREDLRLCRKCLEDGRPLAFPLARHDVSRQFRIPEKLYGRQQELKTLLRRFDQAAGGETRLVLVHGGAGIGKTALVGELFKSVAGRRGHCVSGKFEQLERNEPYSALLRAFGDLIRQVLMEPEDAVAQWKEKLARALGPNARVIADVLPELELITGPARPVQELSAFETRNRFRRVVQNFIGVFAAGQPLAIFLDDLQWADASTLEILRDLTLANEGHVLFLLAYRDDEESRSFLERTLNELRGNGRNVSELKLGPLGSDELRMLIADTLGTETAGDEIVTIVRNKTDGNPHYVGEFLTALFQKGLIYFDPRDENGWRADPAALRSVRGTENVMELMAGRIRQLPAECREVLELASCLGGSFTLETLSALRPGDFLEVYRALWPPLQQGLILPAGTESGYPAAWDELPETGAAGLLTYEFVHDRVQQAAYSLIPEDRRRNVHRDIGVLLGEKQNDNDHEKDEDRIFEIVKHWNAAADVLTPEERLAAVRLNLAAGERARQSSAFASGLRYFRQGVALLPPGHWEEHYDLSFRLHFLRYECEQQTGETAAMERSCAVLMERSRFSAEKARVLHVKMLTHTLAANYGEAVETARAALQLTGIRLPAKPGPLRVALELGRVKLRLATRGVACLETLPECTDPLEVLRIRILIDLTGPAYQSDQNLFALCLLKMMTLTLRHGITMYSTMGIGLYGVLEGVLGNLQAAYGLGEIGLRLARRYDSLFMIGRNSYMMAIWFSGWREPLERSVDYIQRAHRAALDSGDIYTASYSADNPPFLQLLAGRPLDEIQEEATRYLSFVRGVEYEEGPDFLLPYLQFVACLQGRTESPGDFSDGEYDEERHLEALRASDNALPLSFYCFIKMKALFLYGDYSGVLEVARESRRVIAISTCLIYVSVHYFYEALAAAALAGDLRGRERRRALRTLRANHRRIRGWAGDCPENFRQMDLLLQAERDRLAGRESRAMSAYDAAIQWAEHRGFLHHQAVANERAALFHGAAGRPGPAAYYLREAVFCFHRWGATGKVRQLERRFAAGGSIAGSDAALPTTTLTSTALARFERIEYYTLLKAAEAISGSLVLEELLKKLLGIALENAGARLGFFIRDRDGEWTIEARARTVSEATGETLNIETDPRPLRGSRELCTAVVDLVARTRESILLDNAMEAERFRDDEYIRNTRSRSLLCTPVLHQGKLSGILYLENNLTPGVFSEKRFELLRMLSSQAAIAVENAFLYENLRRTQENLSGSHERLEEYSRTLENKVAERTRQLESALAKENELSLGLRTALAREQEMIEIKNLFFAMVAHEYYTPLTAITTATYLLRQHGDQLPLAEKMEKLERIETDVRRLTSLMEDAMTLGHRNKLEITSVDLVDCCRRIIMEIESAHPGCVIRLRGLEARRVVLLDRELFRQILLNLLTNAVKYSPARRPVDLRFREWRGDLVFSISDEGVGIARADRGRIFEPFQRGNNSKSLTGYGMGLAIVKKAVEFLYGEISLQSELNRGSRFTVRLPLARLAEIAETEPGENSPP